MKDPADSPKPMPHAPQPLPQTKEERIRDLLEHADWLGRLAHQLVRDGAEAEDVLQETLLVASATGAPIGVPERSWLAGITRNLVRARRRREGRLKERERLASRAEAGSSSAATDVALIERQKILLAGVEGLPDAQRRAVLMRYYEGLPPRQIAAAEGVAVSTVHTRIQRGLDTLRSELDESFGDRRTWATWMVPMGGAAPKAQGFAAMAVLAVAITALTVVVGFSAWSLSQPEGSPSAAAPDLNAGIELASAALQDGPTADLENALAEVPVDPTAARLNAEATSRGPVSVRIVDDGVPVPNADVIALPKAALAHKPVPHFDLEATLWNEGTRLRANKEGVCVVDVPAPFFLLASDKSRLGVKTIERGDLDPTLELEPAARLTVRVVDSSGKPLTHAAQEGLGVTAYTRLKLPGESIGVDPNDIRMNTAHLLKSGEAWFQHRWLGSEWSEAEVGPDNWLAASIDAVALDIPGAAEFEPEAIVERRFLPFKKRQTRQERTLTLPPVGSLRFVLVDRHGKLDSVDGFVSVRFKLPRFESTRTTEYTAEIIAGVALFPRCVIGSRPFQATLSVPELGATWTVDGVTPDQERAIRNITTQLPNQPAVTAKLVDEQGRPLSKVAVALCHGEPGAEPSRVYGHVQATSSSAGVVRFQLRKEVKLGPPFSITATRVRNSEVEEAIALFELSEDEIRAGVDLGELVVGWERPTSVTGQVVDDEGVPIPGVHVTLERRGAYEKGARTNVDGEFKISAALGASSKLSLRDPTREFMPVEMALSLSAMKTPLAITMQRGGSFLGQINTSPFRVGDRMLQVLLWDEDQKHSWTETLEPGSVRARALRPGKYRVELRLFLGVVPIATVDGVEIADGRETRDPRFDGIRLSDLVREISVTVDGDIPKRRPMMKVNATSPTKSDEPRSIYWLNPRQDKVSPYLLPLQIPHSVRFTSHDGRSVFYPDGLALGETVNVTYPKPIQVRIELQGRADSGYDYSLVGEVGTEAEGVYVSLHGQDLDEVSTSVVAEFPGPGIYRLKKAKKPKPASEPGGYIYQSVPEPTTATVEVRKGETSTLRIDAPLAKE